MRQLLLSEVSTGRSPRTRPKLTLHHLSQLSVKGRLLETRNHAYRRPARQCSVPFCLNLSTNVCRAYCTRLPWLCAHAPNRPFSAKIVLTSATNGFAPWPGLFSSARQCQILRFQSQCDLRFENRTAAGHSDVSRPEMKMSIPTMSVWPARLDAVLVYRSFSLKVFSSITNRCCGDPKIRNQNVCRLS